MKRKILSMLLSLAMVMSLIPMAMTVQAADGWTARENAVDLRVGLLGDSHIGNSDSVASPSNDGGCYYVQKAVAAHKALGANQLDGLALTGDIVYQSNDNFTNHYDQLNLMLNEYGEDFPMVFAMGNHEYPQNAHQKDNAADAGASVLILAEYNADGTLAQTIKSAACTDGKATLSYTKAEGKTYKLFLWNSIEGMKPVADNVEY